MAGLRGLVLHLLLLSGRILSMASALTITGFLAIVLGLLYHFAALRVFNLLVPKDGEGRRIAANIPYGSHPRQRLDVYAPDRPLQPGARMPALLFIYGGSWDSGRKEDYAFVGRAFAARGFLTAIADYRLVPGVHYPAFVDDAAAAMRWLAREAGSFEGTPGRLFIVGHSAGAYSAVQAVLRHDLHTVVSAIASLAGPFDFLPLDSPKSIAAFGQVDDLKETQPVHADLSQAPPIQLLHGCEDVTVGLHNSWNLHMGVLQAGRESVLRFYERIGHVGIMLALAKPLRSRAPVLDEIVAFLQRYV